MAEELEKKNAGPQMRALYQTMRRKLWRVDVLKFQGILGQKKTVKPTNGNNR